jgi:hypothetical protein
MQRSDSIGAIGAALAKAQADIKPAIKDAKNPHFQQNYADLSSVWEACRAKLAANGIAVVQSPEANDAQVSITTLLVHASGEWISGTLTLKARDASPQSVGSAITYGRRYGLASMVGVAPDDDDGEGAQGRGKATAAPAAKPKAEPRRDAPVITDDQRKRLFAVATKQGWSDDDIKTLLGRYGFTSSRDITTKDYDAIVRVIETGEAA